MKQIKKVFLAVTLLGMKMVMSMETEIAMPSKEKLEELVRNQKCVALIENTTLIATLTVKTKQAWDVVQAVEMSIQQYADSYLNKGLNGIDHEELVTIAYSQDKLVKALLGKHYDEIFDLNKKVQ
jgi:hypothetical protein